MPKMRFSRTTLIAAGIVALAGITIACLLWRNRPPEGYPPEAVAQARAAARYFDSLPRVDIHDRTAVAATFAAGRPIPGQRRTVDRVDDSVRQALFEFIADWLYVRLDRNPDTYEAWARSRGYTLTLERSDADEFPSMRRSSRRDAYADMTGHQPFPPDMPPIECFRLCYRKHFDLRNGMMRTVAITSACDVVFIRLVAAEQDPIYPSPFPMERYDGVERWSGFMTAGNSVHWAPPVLLKDVLRRDGEALTGIVSTALLSEKGEWTPTRFAAYWDPAAHSWHFIQISSSNKLNMGVYFER